MFVFLLWHLLQKHVHCYTQNRHTYPHTHMYQIPIVTTCVIESTDSLSTGQAVGISVVVTFIVSVLIGLAVGVGVTYLIMHDKTYKTVDVPTEAPPQQQ